MSHEEMLRIGAVVAAVALLVAPYRQQIVDAIEAAIEAAKPHGSTIWRAMAAGLLVAAAWGKIPMPTLPAVVPVVTVETPAVPLQTAVAPIAKALAGLPASDRMLWASVWKKAAVVVRGDTSREAATFSDTESLRMFTILALDVAWRRIGGHAPGSVPGLRQSVESALTGTLGLDYGPVTPEIRSAYAAMAEAIAWAGIHGG